jgi:hypothetical protein
MQLPFHLLQSSLFYRCLLSLLIRPQPLLLRQRPRLLRFSLHLLQLPIHRLDFHPLLVCQRSHLLRFSLHLLQLPIHRLGFHPFLVYRLSLFRHSHPLSFHHSYLRRRLLTRAQQKLVMLHKTRRHTLKALLLEQDLNFELLVLHPRPSSLHAQKPDLFRQL